MANIAYIDLDEGELMHWKYIKRVKLPNGKYRYYYDQSELDRYESMAKTASENRNLASFEAGKRMTKRQEAEKYMSIAYERYDKAKTAKEKVNASDDIHKTKDYLKKTRAAERTALENYNRAEYAATMAEKTYTTRKISSFIPRTIAKGAVKVANLLSGADKRTKKR
jgi:hypothetical protein